MPLIRTKDGIVLEIPEGMAPDAPEVRAAVEAERSGRFKRRMEAPDMKRRIEGDVAAAREMSDPTKDMSALDKVRANIGAGMHSAWTGLKQITPGLKSPTDEEVRDKREADERLAAGTDLGIGADWMPTAGKALQVGGEIAPTLAIPAGAATGAASRVLPRAVQALVRNPIGAGAVAGGASGALMPTTSDESRALNTAVGAGAGAALPLGVAAYRAGRNLYGAGRRAGQELLEGLGDEAAAIPGQVAAREAQRRGTSAAAREIPESLAEASGSVRAAQMESASGRVPDETAGWGAFRQGQNQARHRAVQEATAEAEMLGSRSDARALTTDPMRERALTAAGADRWVHQPVAEAAEAILTSDARVNPAVRRVADLVLSSMDERAAAPITPRGLYELRKLLTDKLHGPSVIGDELSAAVKGADRQTMQLVAAIDETLNRSSRGRWKRYLDTYARSSRPVDQAKAAQLAREVFEREGIAELGGVPEVTATRLGQAMRAAKGEPSRRFPLQLSPTAHQGMEDVLNQVTRANEPQKARKLAGTAGGGSQTSTDLAQDAARDAARSLLGDAARSIPGLRGVIQHLDAGTQRELAVLLQNPQRAVQALQEAQRLGQPLSAAQTALLQAVSTTAGGALPRAMQSQQMR